MQTRQEQIEKFLRFTQKYNCQDESIMRKVNHSQRVAYDCELIVRSLNLNEQDVLLAFTVGLLHDFARFEQWTRFKSFMDTPLFDHGEVGAKMLFDDGLIVDYCKDKEQYKVIEFAIKNHNKYKIDENGASQREILFAKIVRDGDKLDLFRQMQDNGQFAISKNNIYSGLSKEVQEQFFKHSNINVKYRKSNLDRAVFQLAFGFDLNMIESKKIYLENKYYNLPFKNYNAFLNDDEKIKLLQLTEYLQKFIEQEINTKNK